MEVMHCYGDSILDESLKNSGELTALGLLTENIVDGIPKKAKVIDVL